MADTEDQDQDESATGTQADKDRGDDSCGAPAELDAAAQNARLRSKQDAQPNTCVYVGFLGWWVTEKDLIEYFAPYGDLVSVRVSADATSMTRCSCYLLLTTCPQHNHNHNQQLWPVYTVSAECCLCAAYLFCSPTLKLLNHCVPAWTAVAHTPQCPYDTVASMHDFSHSVPAIL